MFGSKFQKVSFYCGGHSGKIKIPKDVTTELIFNQGTSGSYHAFIRDGVILGELTYFEPTKKLQKLTVQGRPGNVVYVKDEEAAKYNLKATHYSASGMVVSSVFKDLQEAVDYAISTGSLPPES